MADDGARRERPLKLAERKVPAKLKETRPPLWSSKIHGVPNRYTPSIKLPDQPPPGTALVVAGGAAVGGPAAGAATARGAGALTTRETRLTAPLVPSEDVINLKIQEREIELRRNLRELAAMSKLHETEKSILIRTFECFDFDRTGKVSRDGCRKALRSLGVQVDEFEIERIFDKYGQDMHRMMPYDVFTARLFTSSNRILAWTEQRHEAFKGDDTKADLAFNGKIIYPKGKLGSVYTPANWDPAQAERSKQPPDAMLELEYVYGYRGDDSVYSPNLFYTAAREIAYFTAGVGVVFNKEASAQRFFLGHTDDILCLTLDPTRNICATGQKKPIGSQPYVCVWDVNSMQELQRLPHNKYDGDPAVLAVQFSRDGALLVSLQKDIDHHITIWDWKAGTPLLQEKTLKGPAPMGIPMLFGVAWNGFERKELEAEANALDFCTYGVKGLQFWRLPKSVKDGAVRYTRAKMNKYVVVGGTGDMPSLSHHNCALWLPNGDCVSGTKAGELWLWRDTKYFWSTQAHKSELTALTLRADGTRLLSASSNGTIMEWNVEGSTPVPTSLRTIPPQYADAKSPGIKALDCYPGSDIFIVGSSSSDILEVDHDPEPVVKGHNDRLDAVAAHPRRADEYASACYSGRCFIWDAVNKQPLLPFGAPSPHGSDECTCLAYSPDGHEIAVGIASGYWFVYNTQHKANAHLHVPENEPKRNRITGKPVLEDQGVACLSFCPNGETLAAACYDQAIHLFSVRKDLAEDEALAVNNKQRYRRIGKCVGHSSTVNRLDWDQHGILLQSNSTANEMLYWWGQPGKSKERLQEKGLWPENRKELPRPGEQATEIQREFERWASWTSIIGFPVMGIFPTGVPPEKLNVVAVSKGSGGKEDARARGRVLVAATDMGEVLVFNFPAVIDGGPYYKLNGHSSFVKNVCWLADDSRVISVGGSDRSMLQWAVRWRTSAGFVGYQPPARRDEHGELPPPPPPPVKAANQSAAAPSAVPLAKGAPVATGSAAADDQKRAEQASAVAALERQMKAIEEQQVSLRAELSRLKK